MEIFFKRYAWTLNVAVVVLAAVVAGRTVSALSAVHLAEPPTIEPDQRERPRAVHAVTATVSAQGLASVFGVKLPSDEPAPDPEPDEPEIDLGDEVPTSLNATLVATIEARPDRYSVALITDNSARSTAVYGVGDMLMGSAEIVRVERRRVLIRNAGRTEYLEMDGEEGAVTPPVAATRRPTVAATRRGGGDAEGGAPTGPDLSDSIRRVGDNEYAVAQDALESTLSNLNTIATQARIVPAFKNGVAEGFKLFSIRPGSIYAQIGIQNGDVIRKINGFEINSPDRALEVYQRLRDARRVEVELERRGQTINKVYNIE
jgi:general secretion pathway protein C